MENIQSLPAINVANKKEPKKVKIMQFGEGNFLRAFVDWIINEMNKANVFDGGVVVVQPMPFGRCKELNDADGLYTLYLQGLQDGKAVRKHEVIKCLQDFVNPFEEYNKYLDYALSDDLEFIISNTTEAGIAFDPNDTDFTKCPVSYPGKLLAFLEKRYNAGKKGLYIIPCELIDYNGKKLREVLVQLAEHKGMDKNFINWIIEENKFFNTLVDRIVPGYPRNEAVEFQQALGYQDQNMVVGEIFHLWCIDGNSVEDKKQAMANLAELQAKFPCDKAGLNVLFVESIVPYKQRKVKILNGSHTTLVPVSYLAGIDAVKETIEDPELGKFVKEFIFNEVIPTIDIPEDQMIAYSNSVLERYMNPYVHHLLMSIALNSSTKYKERVLPSVLQYMERKNALPTHALFSLAALITFYKGVRLSDGSKIEISDTNTAWVELLAKLWAENDVTTEAGAKTIVSTVLGLKDHWGVDLNTFAGVTDYVTSALIAINTKPMKEAIKAIVK
ncbi:MAG: tagaturonate reductase [Anaeroplasmataceae bacterium]